MSDAPRSPAPSDPVRGVFLGDLAHDLSTPLTAIHGALELLLSGAYGPLDGEQRSLLLEVLASAREMRAIVQDVADLGALDGSRLVFGAARVDVGAILDELRASIGEAASKRGVTFTLDAPPAGTVIETDDRRLRQILTCVPGYAIKAARRGSQVDAVVAHHDGRLQVEVRATGITLNGDPQMLFADRRDPTPGVPKPYRGPGLGLPLVGRMVQAWGGRVRADMSDGMLLLAVDVPARAV
ncbi:MAG TPA: HAMP domain-containing sensor histidine kinase [Vicinamibacterales bacterium]|jgi:signal transduction histidine kinase|nr:HAMP domain-containing sensor histidine kinase [Vicinamibacterales bacterium]